MVPQVTTVVIVDHELRKHGANMGVEELGGSFWLFLFGIIKKLTTRHLRTWV